MNHDASEPAYLKADEVAKLLGVSRKSVYPLAQDPTLPRIQIGGVLRFPRGRLEAWLRAREQGFGRPARREVTQP